MKNKNEMFRSYGRITAQGEKSVRFWIKVLEVEKDVEDALATMRDKLVLDNMSLVLLRSIWLYWCLDKGWVP